MADAYLEALRDYLSGPEWRQSVEIFIVSNRKYFSNITEMDHQQHDLWKTFQEIVEAILEMALASVGGDFSQLEHAIDVVQSQPSRGPREDVVKDVLQQLTSFADFHSFATMMKTAYDTAQEEARAQGNTSQVDSHVDTLLRMGFPIFAIETTVAEAQPNASLEDLVIALSGLISAGPTAGAGASAKFEGSGHGYHYDVHGSAPASPSDGRSSKRDADGSGSGPSRALLKFAKEAAEEGEEVDLNELNAKFVIAESVLDSFDHSVRAELVSGNTMHALLRWAEDMKLLLSDIHTAYEEALPCKAMCFNCQDGLVDWYRRLEATRQDIDQASLAGNMLSDAEMRRMAELDKIAAMGSADEQALHRLISRHDQVCKEVEALHRQCGLLVASDRRGVKRESLEELYLFLKQQVAEGVDLDSITDELYERVYGVVSSAKGAEVINLLLDMHVFEDEQNMLQRTIHSMLGVPEGDHAHGAAEGYGDAAKLSDIGFDSFAPGQGGEHQSGQWDAADSDYKHVRAVMESNHDVKGGDQKTTPAFEVPGAHAALAHGAMHSTSSHMMMADSKETAAASTAHREEAQLTTLKERHRQSVEQLRELLESEKARKLKALEEKLIRRRTLHQRALQQVPQGEEKGEDDHIAELRKAVEEAEDQIEVVQMEHEATAESMVSGLKKRCLNEVAAARKKLSAMDEKEHARGAPLLDHEDLANAHRAAADSLKQRFERDQKALLESLEAERTKQRDRVLKQLAAKRMKRGAGPSSVDAAEEEKKALIAMNVEFDAMQATALGKAQEHALLALAAMHLTEGDLAAGTKESGGGDEDDDADYLDEDTRTSSGAHIGKGREWLDKVARVKQSYLGAASELLQRLRVQAISAAGAESEGGDAEGAFEEVAGLMSKVITDAFDNRFEEDTAALDSAAFMAGVSGKHVPGKDTSKADGARLRAGILEEFEKAKRELEDGFLQAQRAGREKLRDRRQRGARGSAGAGGDAKGGQDGSDIEEEDAEAAQQRLARSQKLQEAMMERVVDDFLGGEPVQDVAAAYESALEARSSAASATTSSLASKARRDSAEWAESEDLKERSRIKSVHVEKEQSLILELEAAMAEKKKALEDRLRRRRQSSGDGMLKPAEAAEAREETNLLEQAFEKVAAHLKSMSKEQLARMDVGSLSDFLDRSAQGERPSLPGSSVPTLSPSGTSALPPLTRLHTNATLLRHTDAPPPDYVKDTGEAEHEASAEGGGGGSEFVTGSRQSVIHRSREEKESMAGEVKRISLEYNEEKQKLDLMMKIQQARQRQSLQRKLFEKSQRKQQQQQQQAHGDEEGDEGYHADCKSDYNSIEIGANRGLAAMKLRSSANLQPAFRGLPAEAYQAGAGPTSSGGAGYSSASKVQTQQSMALRGMNLGPMMRK